MFIAKQKMWEHLMKNTTTNVSKMMLKGGEGIHKAPEHRCLVESRNDLLDAITWCNIDPLWNHAFLEIPALSLVHMYP